MIPELLELITGMNLVEATVESALNNKDIHVGYAPIEVFYSTYILHSVQKGILKNVYFNEEIQGNIIDKVFYKELGEEIDVFNKSNNAIGIVFLKYRSVEEMRYKMENMNQFIEIEVSS